jgi:hypothetical protein
MCQKIRRSEHLHSYAYSAQYSLHPDHNHLGALLKKDLGVLLDVHKKSNTLLTKVSTLGFVAELFETKLSTVLSIPSMT